MNEQEIQTDTDDTEGNGMKWGGSPEVTDTDDTEGNVMKAIGKALPDTAKPNRVMKPKI